MSSLTLVVLTGFLWAASREVEATLLHTAGGRAQAVADQLASLLAESAAHRLVEVGRIASHDSVRQYLTNPTDHNREAVHQLLNSLPAPAGGQTAELWNTRQERLVNVAVPGTTSHAGVPSPKTIGTSSGLSPLQESGGVVFYEAADEVRPAAPHADQNISSHPVGFVVVRRRFTAMPPESLNRLAGSDATIKIGNRADGVWTDLSQRTPPPPVDVTQNRIAEYRAADGDVRVGAVAPIPRTPWAIWVEFPRSGILAHVRAFQLRMAAIGVLLVTLAAMGARIVSGRITSPLSAMAAAATAIAGGDYSRRVATNRPDEIGQLGAAFNTMAAEVDGMHRGLEARVTQRTRELDEALAQLSQRSEAQQAHLAAIVESSDDAIFGGSLDGTIQSWNAGAQQMYGYAPDEIIARAISLTVPPDRPNEALDLLKRVGQGEHIRNYETVRVRKDGKRLDVSLTISPIKDSAGRVTGASTVARDMTERKRLEAQLRQSQKMEAVGQLAGGVAHDFNNLLTAILGYSTLVLDELDAGHPIRGDIQEIHKAGESAASLTRQLLAFSRRQILQPQILDLNAVVSRMDSLLRRLIGENILLVTHPAPALDRVNADPGQIEQIVMNLAVNARDAMPGGGKLTIETANVDLDEGFAASHPSTQPGPHVMLAISDTGIGLDERTKAQIFEPFFTTKKRGEGTGLGLSTVYGIVKQSGGSIWVYSEPAHGTTFKVYLPSAPQEEDRPVVSVKPRSLNGTETILIAEDQAEVRAVARAVLTRHGYTVLEATRGEEALQILHEHAKPIHLLLTDVVMPAMSGRELVRHLQAFRPEIRVLYTSGYTNEAIVRHGVLESGIAFIQKPFTPRGLLQRVREVLDAGKVKSEA